MSLYERYILPVVIDAACSMGPIMELRNKVVPFCEGDVLEVGAGSGINFSLYNPKLVKCVWALEPSLGMRHKAHVNFKNAPVPVQWLDLPGEKIPLANNTVDTVLLTYTLCTIPGYAQALAEMHRVMRPGAKLLFAEHGLAPDERVQYWQNTLTPLWKKCAGGCHLNRPIAEYISSAGFTIQELTNLYIEKAPRFAGYMYYGQAIKPISD